MIDYDGPLHINELNIEELVNTFVAQGLRTLTTKIKPLHPAHKSICNDTSRHKVLACGRRFGKSILATFIAAAVLLQKGRKVWIVGPTYKHTDKIFEPLYHLFYTTLKLATPAKGGRASRSDRIILLSNGSSVEGKSCERRDQLVGDAIDLLIWDEMGLVPNAKDIYEQELRATLMDKHGSSIFISTPRGRNDFFFYYSLGKTGKEAREKIQRGEPLSDYENSSLDWSSFQFSSYDNTHEKGGYISKAEIDAARLTVPSVKFRQEYLADFTAVADTAFPEFDPETQIVDWDFNPALPAYSTLDFNYQSPCTTLYFQIDPNMNVLIFDEFHPEEAHKTVHAQALQLLETDRKLDYSIDLVIADIAGQQVGYNGRSAWDDLEDYGIYPVGKKQKLEIGCDLIRLLCSFPKINEKNEPVFDEEGNPVIIPKLFINRRCKHTIFALETARAPKSQDGFVKEGYIDDNVVDGPLDALRYGLVYLFNHSGKFSLVPVK